MADNKIIIDGVDVSRCSNYDHDSYFECKDGCCHCDEIPNCYFKQLKHKEQECEELHNRTASIIYNLTGGRLSYSTYTLEGCEDAYRDQLSIDVEKATKELEEENEILKSENFTFEELIKTQEELIDNYKQALDEIEHAISNFPSEGVQEMSQTQIECSQYFLSVSETKLQKILDTINKAKVGG